MRCGAASRLLVAILLVAVAFLPGDPPTAQPTAGATLTVLRGSAAVLRADGAQLSPVASGLATTVGDQIATLARSSALLTFFNGSELELGADTTIVVREMTSEGARANITVENVVGSTVHRVAALTDANSIYRVDSGGTVTLVRGTTFSHRREPNGDVTVAVADGDVEFPRPVFVLRKGERRTATERGAIETDRFDPASSLFDAVASAVSASNPSGTENPGQATGSRSAPEQPGRNEQPDGDVRPARTGIVLLSAAGAGTFRLDVSSTEGIAIGETVLISPGRPTAEAAIVVGFGSLILDRPLQFSHAAGEDVVKGGPIPPLPGAATQTPTPSLTPSPTSTLTPTVTPTLNPIIAQWIFSADYLLFPNQANPGPDRYGNAGVWHMLYSDGLAHDPSTYHLFFAFEPFDKVWFLPPDGYPFVGVSDDRVAGGHPYFGRLLAIGWRSPIFGIVRVSGRLADDDVTCGNGITWEIQKGSTALATGTILNDAQTVPATGNLAAIPVSVGQFLYLVVDPRANQADCDSTVFEFVVEQIAG